MEDAFDGSTRRNLRHIIVAREDEPEPELQIGLDDGEEKEKGLVDEEKGKGDEKAGESTSVEKEKGGESTVESSSVESSAGDSDAEPGVLQPVKYYVLDEADSLADVKAHPGDSEARLKSKPLARITDICAAFPLHPLPLGSTIMISRLLQCCS